MDDEKKTWLGLEAALILSVILSVLFVLAIMEFIH